MCFNELDNLRFVQKVVSGVPNVPPTNHPSEGGWDDNSLFEGEVAMDSNTGFVYIRNGAKVVNITTGKPSSNTYFLVVDDTLFPSGNSTELTIWNDLYIDSAVSLNGGTVAGLQVDGNPYTYGDPINIGSILTVTHVADGCTKINFVDL